MNTFHKILFVLAIFIANCISASAIEFTVDGVRYSVNNDNTTVTVAGYPSGSKPTGDLTIPESVTFGGISFPVTSIGYYAFSGCSGLTSVIIGNSVTSIGSQAFYGCSGLTSVIIGNSVTSIGSLAFYGCSGLTSVTIPNSVTSIGNNAFEYCRGLTSGTIGNSVTSIGDYAFSGCSGLTSVTIPNSVTKIGYEAFSSTAWYNNQPDGLVYVGPVAYKYKGTMPSGTSIVLKEGTTGITESAFSGCSGLTSVTIPGSVKYIGRKAFSSSNELTEVVWNAKSCNIDYNPSSESSHPFYSCPIIKLIVGDEVQQIPSYLMYKQIFLTSVTIPNSVTSIGNEAFDGCSGLTSVVWNAKNYYSHFPYSPFEGLTNIKSFEFGSEVEKIPAYLCYGLTGLTSVTIPNSVTSIGNYAFAYCRGLTSVTIPNSVTSIGNYAFEYCSGLTSVTIGNSVTSIGDCAFDSCSGLTSVTIPNSVTSIGNYAFAYCPGLTSVIIGNSVTSIGNSAFYGCSGLTSVIWNVKNFKDFSSSSAPFKDLTNIKSFEFGSEVEKIPAYLCCGLTGLTSVTIPNSVTSIGNYAFAYCSGLTSVIIGNSVTSIGSHAFFVCSGLTSVTIPNSVTSIGSYAFCVCSGLTSVTIGNSVTSIGSNAFEGCRGLTSVTIPNSVTSIGSQAFYGCSGLTSVTIGNSVTSIGNIAFYGCSGLTSVTIPNSVTSIGGSAFASCSGLTSVIIGNSVTSIGDYAFSGCSGLTRIDAYPNPAKVSMGSNVFSKVPKDGTLHVLPKYLSAYQTASQWWEFYNIKADLTETDGIEEVSIDEIDRTLPMNVYNMNGVKVGDTLEGLPAGIYIVRQDGKSAKVMK